MRLGNLCVEALLPIPALVVLAGAVAWVSGGCRSYPSLGPTRGKLAIGAGRVD